MDRARALPLRRLRLDVNARWFSPTPSRPGSIASAIVCQPTRSSTRASLLALRPLILQLDRLPLLVCMDPHRELHGGPRLLDRERHLERRERIRDRRAHPVDRVAERPARDRHAEPRVAREPDPAGVDHELAVDEPMRRVAIVDQIEHRVLGAHRWRLGGRIVWRHGDRVVAGERGVRG